MNHQSALDEVFISRLTEIVNEHIANEHFGAEELSLAAGMSRSHIHRRLKSIQNQSVSHFIRSIRLQEAMKKLRESESSASEIAYQVGFSSPAYFNRCFHEQYGYPPGEFRKHGLASFESADMAKNLPVVDNNKIDKSPLMIQGWFGRNRRWILPFIFFVILMTLAYSSYNYLFEQQRALRNGKYSKKSIIVLPFRNLSDNPENQYFADGIMEDILNSLFRINDFKVISRTTSEHFRESGLTAGEIARQVNVSNVLEGSVRQQGNMVRITIQLIDATHDRHLWSSNFDRELTDVMGIQGEIALMVADKLKAVLSDSEIEEIGILPTRNPEAYDNYLRGRFLLNKANSEQRFDINKEGLMASLQYFEKAIGADSSFALAYAGLANAWFNLSAWGWLQPYSLGIDNARELSAKALKIDPDCAEAHTIIGAYLVWPERRFEEGRLEFHKALSLNPNFPYAHQVYAQLLMITGPIEDARIHMNRALELEPYFWVIQNLNAWVYYFEQKYSKAIESCIIAKDLNPDFIENNWLFFLNYAKMGDGLSAKIELLAIVQKFYPDGQMTDEINEAFKTSGIEGLFNWLIDANLHKPVRAPGLNGHPYYLAWWYAIVGDRENSLYWLGKNMEATNRLYVYLNLIATNPDFDILRDEPEFLKIIEDIGLKPYHRRPPL